MNKQGIIKPLVAVFFVALLAAPYAIDRFKGENNSDQPADEDDALKRYGFYLEEVSVASGIAFVHQSPQLDARLEHIMPQVASMGASVSVTDFDNDGWQDIYLTNSRHGSENALYRNMGDGTFRDVAAELGVAALNTEAAGVSMGSVWADYDNDGYEDLFVYRWGKPALFRNDKGRGFIDVSKKASLPEWVNANAATWLDYNNDGHVDLFLAGYYDENIDLWNLKTTVIMPESFEYARNGGRKYLFRNNGDGTFTEVSEELGLESRRWTLAASAADLTGNGYPDLVLANDYGVDQLFINEEGKRFRNAGDEAGMGFAPKSGMNVSYGDILNQGRFSIYITNISEPGVLIQGNNLWVPREGGGNTVTFQNLAGNLGVELGGWCYGAQFCDLNNDGNTDLYVTNGYVSAAKGTDYWYDFSKVAGGNKSIISDAKNWPAMEGRSLSGYQKNKLWLNDGAGKFREIAGAVGGGLDLDSRSVAVADLWNRGVMDIIVASQNGPVKVYKNNTADRNHWIAFKLEGTRSNGSAIGAELKLYWGGKRQLQVVSGGSGFSSQNQRPVHFGLGDHTSVDKLEIRWPSGIKQTVENPAVDQLHIVQEQKQNTRQLGYNE